MLREKDQCDCSTSTDVGLRDRDSAVDQLSREETGNDRDEDVQKDMWPLTIRNDNIID